jgi:hypothetical protein
VLLLRSAPKTGAARKPAAQGKKGFVVWVTQAKSLLGMTGSHALTHVLCALTKIYSAR